MASDGSSSSSSVLVCMYLVWFIGGWRSPTADHITCRILVGYKPVIMLANGWCGNSHAGGRAFRIDPHQFLSIPLLRRAQFVSVTGVEAHNDAPAAKDDTHWPLEDASGIQRRGTELIGVQSGRANASDNCELGNPGREKRLLTLEKCRNWKSDVTNKMIRASCNQTKRQMRSSIVERFDEVDDAEGEEGKGSAESDFGRSSLASAHTSKKWRGG